MTRPRRFLAALPVLGLTVALLGCKGNGGQAPAGPAPDGKGQRPADLGPQAAGKRSFVKNRCLTCHLVNGGSPVPGSVPGKKRKGPDLGKTARDRRRSVEWLMAYVRDPKSKDPDAKMPAQDKITDTDLRAVAEYLASLE
jgi:mono/diheme cytochrome c family protein